MFFSFQRLPPALIWLFATMMICPCASAHGDLHLQINVISERLATNQAAPELWLRRADLNRQHGDFPAASSDLEHATRLRPGWPAISLQHARIAFDQKDFTGCIAAATQCATNNPLQSEALTLRARALVQLGKFSDAVADYDALLAATNSCASLPDLYHERAQILAGLRRWDEALRGLDAGMARLGNLPSLALPAIEYERQRGHPAAARERLERARKFMSADDYARRFSELQPNIDPR